jgi:hypothetical protein
MPRKHRDSTVSTPIDTLSVSIPVNCDPSDTEFLVESLYPVHKVHMFIGRTSPCKDEIATFVLDQFINPWCQGLPVFGHKSHPMPFCYVDCCDSLLRLALILFNLRHPALEDFPGISLIDNPPPFPDTDLFDHCLYIARQCVPDLKVLFLDGYAHILPGDPHDDADTERFNARVDKAAREENITVIGIDEFDNLDEMKAGMEARRRKFQ